MKVSLFLVAAVALVGTASANCMRGIFSGTQGSRESALISAACSAGLRGDELRQFMAQCAHECAHFNTMEEYASGAAYEGRRDLGNTQPGDGRRYKGRGYIQLTGRANYRTFGRALGLDLEGNPLLALQPRIAARVAIKYWKDRVRPRVRNYCNTRDATYYINGGSNGLSDRENYFRKYGGCGGTSGGTSGGGGGSRCSGKCINIHTTTCGSTPRTGLCPGAWNIQCCTSSASSSCSTCVKNGGGRGCATGACSSASYSCKNCLNNYGGKGCLSRCSSTFDEMDTDFEHKAFDEVEEVEGMWTDMDETSASSCSRERFEQGILDRPNGIRRSSNPFSFSDLQNGRFVDARTCLSRNFNLCCSVCTGDVLYDSCWDRCTGRMHFPECNIAYYDEEDEDQYYI